jgi:hypothetical protein
MSISQASLENLALGRGKRERLGNETVSMRMSSLTKQHLEQIAETYGCLYGGKPWIAGLLEKISSGVLVVVPAPQYPLYDLDNLDPKQAARDRARKKKSGIKKA